MREFRQLGFDLGIQIEWNETKFTIKRTTRSLMLIEGSLEVDF